MSFAVGAKSTKPGSKATAHGLKSGAKPPRVPVGMLHFIDPDNQPGNASMYDAVCGESSLMMVDDLWDGPVDNERCETCGEAAWAIEFEELQRQMLK